MKRNFLLIAFIACAVSASAQIPSYIPTNGLIGWWPFNGNANDESGSNNNGTSMGATLTTDRFGNDSSAYLFDGISTYISVPTSASLESPTVGVSMTAWVYLNGYSLVGQAFGPIMTKSDNPANAYMYRFTIDINGVSFYAGTNNWTNNTGAAYNFSLNQWYLLTAVLDSFNSYFYMNDSLVATNAYTTNITVNSLPLEFGRDVPGATEVFNGKLDDIGLWNRALSHSEVSVMYHSCQLALTAQPVNETVTDGNDAAFTVAANDTAATYQWQNNIGSGFSNLANGGQYNGVNNDTLTVTAVTPSNNNEVFRCVVDLAACADTSGDALLTVQPNGIAEITDNNSFSVYPNPSDGFLNFHFNNTKPSAVTLSIYNSLGSLVMQKENPGSDFRYSVSELADGLYMAIMTNGNSNKMIKLIVRH